MTFDPPLTDAASARLAGLREIDAALADIHDFVMGLTPLIDASDWRSEGVRELHDALNGLCRDTLVAQVSLYGARSVAEAL